MSKLAKVFVIAEHVDAMRELAQGAAQLGETTALIWAGDKSQAGGTDTVYYLGELSNERILEHYAPTIINLIKTEQPSLVLVESSRKGRLMAGIIAAAMGTSVLADAAQITVDNGVVTQRMVYGGAALSTERSTAPTTVATVSAGIFEAADTGKAANLVEVPFIAPAPTVKCLERKIKAGESVNLRAAKRIVAVGRGFTSPEELQLAEQLAAAIGAEVGCTRPIAEEEKWMDKARYIGVSGVMAKPELYIGIGISGQVQHMVGVSSARTIIAINSDKNAMIFNQCDYGIVGDLKTVLPALTAKLSK